VIVVVFKVRCQPERASELRSAFAAVLERSRSLPGVMSFDVAEALDDPTAFIATEVFEDAGARERQEALPEVGAVMAILKGGALAAPPDVAVYEGAPTG
jgi:quinol monooxygenase YgiN